MISLTRLSGAPFVLNSDLVERIDSTPDTVITLVDGKKYVVAESLRVVTAVIQRWRAEIIALSHVVEVPSLDLDKLDQLAEPIELQPARRRLEAVDPR